MIDGSSKVLINGLPACRIGDTIVEALGRPNKITIGCPTVLIGGEKIISPVERKQAMSDRVQVQKNSSAPSQMAPSPQFQERPFTDERYQPVASSSTISTDSSGPPKIAPRVLI